MEHYRSEYVCTVLAVLERRAHDEESYSFPRAQTTASNSLG